ncbi:hypothetical protein ACLOJK_010639 [Asimina triloba]
MNDKWEPCYRENRTTRIGEEDDGTTAPARIGENRTADRRRGRREEDDDEQAAAAARRLRALQATTRGEEGKCSCNSARGEEEGRRKMRLRRGKMKFWSEDVG